MLRWKVGTFSTHWQEKERKRKYIISMQLTHSTNVSYCFKLFHQMVLYKETMGYGSDQTKGQVFRKTWSLKKADKKKESWMSLMCFSMLTGQSQTAVYHRISPKTLPDFTSSNRPSTASFTDICSSSSMSSSLSSV